MGTRLEPDRDPASPATPATEGGAIAEGATRREDARGPDERSFESALDPSIFGQIALGAITRRHLAWSLGALLVLALVFVFARAIATSASASAEADALRRLNAGLEQEVDRLRAEKELVGSPAYVGQAGRAYGYGAADEQPFTLAPGAPSPTPLGAAPARPRGDHPPLDDWLALLFGSRSP